MGIINDNGENLGSREENRYKSPLFSICIPTRNRPEMLRDNIKCLLLQTYTDFEVHISDNGTTSLCKGVFDELVGSDDRFYYHRPEQDLGMFDNCEYVLSKAQGEYAMMLEDKQYIFPKCLERCAKVIDKYHAEQISWKMCRYYFDDENGSLQGRVDSYVPYKGIKKKNPLDEVKEWLEWNDFSSLGCKGGGFMHGMFVKQEILNIMRKVFGEVFWGYTVESHIEFSWICAYKNMSHISIEET